MNETQKRIQRSITLNGKNRNIRYGNTSQRLKMKFIVFVLCRNWLLITERNYAGLEYVLMLWSYVSVWVPFLSITHSLNENKQNAKQKEMLNSINHSEIVSTILDGSTPGPQLPTLFFHTNNSATYSQLRVWVPPLLHLHQPAPWRNGMN